MAADIFGRDTTGWKGSFSSSKSTLQFSGSEANALLVTQAQLNYGQQLSRVFELQSDAAYFVIGRVQGRGSLGSVIGPKKVGTAFYKEIGNPCPPQVLTFDFAAGTCAKGDSAFSVNPAAKRVAHGVIAESLGFTVSAQDMLINEQIAFQFASLSTGGKS
jgi:hypothetical protein